jgi:phosphoribosylamine--glycine ligase
MNILILGSGGREHALAWKILQSPQCEKLFVAPGNAGTGLIAQNISIDILEFQKLADFSLNNNINLIIVGPEVPLVHGIVDFFRGDFSLSHIHIIGPDRKGAQLEGSKDFSKNFMNKYKIPTATSKTFHKGTLEEGMAYLEQHPLPVVLKADGLAAGKGVIIAASAHEAKVILHEMLSEDKFGVAGSKVIIEQYLDGIELSAFVITDGNNYTILPEAKDYKRIGEGDTGPNTGGMGAVSPVPFADDAFLKIIEQTIIQPTIHGLKSEGIDYIGFIFFGIMNVKGIPYVIEYNARLGDPESEVIIPRIKSDLVDLFIAASEKRLSEINIEFIPATAATIMLVAGGYPDVYKKGKIISGFENLSNVIVFHAGTKLLENKIVTNGGRVIAITALGNNITEALAKCNQGAATLIWEDKYFRKDIGVDLLSYNIGSIA